MTNSNDYTLRIQLWDADSNYAELSYETFRLLNDDKYNLEVKDFLEPNAHGLMDDLGLSDGAPFSTWDRKNVDGNECDFWFGPWW